MAKDDESNQHGSQNEEGSQFGHDEGKSGSGAYESVSQHEIAKKGGAMQKVLLAGGLILVLGAVGYVGSSIFFPKVPANQQVAQEPVSTPPTPAPEPVVETPVAPVPAENSAVVDPLEANDPLASLTQQDTGSATLPADTSTVAPNTSNDPLANLVGGSSTPVTEAPSVPVPAVATPSPTPAPSPVVPTPTPTPSPSTNGDLAETIGTAVASAIRPVVERLDSMETKFDNRLTALEQGKRAAPVVREAPRTNAVSTKAPVKRKPVAKKRVAPVAPRSPQNSIEIIESKNSVSPVATTTPVSRPSQSAGECRVSSVLDGVAWIKKSDGTFGAYAPGDKLPDGQTISSISADKGIMVNKKTWSCE